MMTTAYYRSYGTGDHQIHHEDPMNERQKKERPAIVEDKRSTDYLRTFKNTFLPNQPKPVRRKPRNSFDSIEVCNIRKEDVQIKKKGFKSKLYQLGQGSFGSVYKGKLDGLKESVVVKQMHEEKSTPANTELEARVMKYLEDTGVVPKCLGTSDLESETPIIVQEYLKGYVPLFELHQSPSKLKPKQWIKLALEMAIGMQRIHDKNVLHCDIKGDNIMVNISDPNNPKVKFIDFGNAVHTHYGTVTFDFSSNAGPLYIAPEVRRGQRATKAADVYSLGRCLHGVAMETESHAMEVLSRKCLEDDPRSRPDSAIIVRQIERIQKIFKPSNANRTIGERLRCW